MSFNSESPINKEFLLIHFNTQLFLSLWFLDCTVDNSQDTKDANMS